MLLLGRRVAGTFDQPDVAGSWEVSNFQGVLYSFVLFLQGVLYKAPRLWILPCARVVICFASGALERPLPALGTSGAAGRVTPGGRAARNAVE